jgi:hypothetical protein
MVILGGVETLYVTVIIKYEAHCGSNKEATPLANEMSKWGLIILTDVWILWELLPNMYKCVIIQNVSADRIHIAAHRVNEKDKLQVANRSMKGLFVNYLTQSSSVCRICASHRDAKSCQREMRDESLFLCADFITRLQCCQVQSVATTHAHGNLTFVNNLMGQMSRMNVALALIFRV